MKKTLRQQQVAALASALQAKTEGAGEVQTIAGWGLGFIVVIDGEEYRVSVAAKREAKVAEVVQEVAAA